MEKLTIDFSNFTNREKAKATSNYSELIGKITDTINEQRRTDEIKKQNWVNYCKWLKEEGRRAKTLKREGRFIQSFKKYGKADNPRMREAFKRTKLYIGEFEYSTIACMLKGWKDNLYYLHDICSKSNNYSATFFSEIK
jgi:hypothetical protein